MIHPASIQRLFLEGRHAVLFGFGPQKLLFDVAGSETWELEDAEVELLGRFAVSDDDTEKRRILGDSPRLAGLLSAGRLFGEDQRKRNPQLERKLRLQDVVVQIAYACNFACTYCYADKGEYGGGESYLMSEKTARETVDFAFAHRGSDILGFCLLGGEPLLNFEAVKALVLHARERGRREGVKTEFSVTTNGAPVTASTIDFLKTHGVAIRLSVDGTKAIHDHFRPDKQGKPTYDAVNEFFGKKMKASGADYSVRTTIFGSHGDQLMEQVRTLFEEHNYKKVKADFIWGVPGTPGLITEENIDSVYNGIDSLGAWFLGKVARGELSWKDLEPFSKYIGRLRRKTKVSPIFTPENRQPNIAGNSVLENNGVECGAGVNVISISANGDIYSCHRTEGNPAYKMGSIRDGVSGESLEYWSSHWRLELAENDCRQCWARYICIGGCPAFGIYKHNDPMQVDRVKCNVRRRMIAHAIRVNSDLDKGGAVDGQSRCSGECADGGCDGAEGV